MPYVIDQEKLDSPDLKILDIAKPPLKFIQHEEYPKMLFLHPKDKAKEHLERIVNNAAERDAALNEGWRITPHIPVVANTHIPMGFEADIPEHEPVSERRGPGRPKTVNAEVA